MNVQFIQWLVYNLLLKLQMCLKILKTIPSKNPGYSTVDIYASSTELFALELLKLAAAGKDDSAYLMYKETVINGSDRRRSSASRQRTASTDRKHGFDWTNAEKTAK